ncbi:MAG: DUF4292 domain-containing protein [Bacteroidia bacterium]
MGRKIVHLILGLGLAFSLMAGCKSTKEATSERRLGAAATLTAALSNKVLPDYAMITGRADAGMGDQSLGFSYRIHLKKDEMIWIKVTKFGFEGARALIRPDSVFVINRLDKSYTATDYSMVKEFTGLDADFGLIQDMLFGNFHPIPKTTDLQVENKKSNPLRYVGEASGYRFGYDIESSRKRLVGMQARHSSKAEFMELLYTAFDDVSKKQSVAVKGELIVGMPDTARVAFHHTKVDLSPGELSFKFSVPDSYQKSR